MLPYWHIVGYQLESDVKFGDFLSFKKLRFGS
jgi:hypothetical protein